MNCKHILPKRNLNIVEDVAFINNVLKSEDIEDVESGVLSLLLDLLYSITNDSLTDAKLFNNLSMRPQIDGEDFRMGRLDGQYRLIRRPIPKPRPPVVIHIPMKRIRYTRLLSSKDGRLVKPYSQRKKRSRFFQRRLKQSLKK